MNFGSWVFPIPKQILIWISTNNRCLPASSVDKKFIIGQAGSGNINQSVTSRILEDRLCKSERIEEFQVDSRRRSRCDVGDNACVDGLSIFIDDIQLCGREERSGYGRITPRRDQHDENICSSGLDEFTDLIGDQEWHRDGQPEEIVVDSGGRYRGLIFQYSEDVVGATPKNVQSLVSDAADVEMLPDQIVVDLRHQTGRTAGRGGLVNNSAAVSIIKEIFSREILDPRWAVGKAKGIVRGQRKEVFI